MDKDTMAILDRTLEALFSDEPAKPVSDDAITEWLEKDSTESMSGFAVWLADELSPAENIVCWNLLKGDDAIALKNFLEKIVRRYARSCMEAGL